MASSFDAHHNAYSTGMSVSRFVSRVHMSTMSRNFFFPPSDDLKERKDSRHMGCVCNAVLVLLKACAHLLDGRDK